MTEMFMQPVHPGVEATQMRLISCSQLIRNIISLLILKGLQRKLLSETKHPIVFALDVTGSIGDWTKVIMGGSRLSTTSYPCSTARL